jgi:hypothetical protein
MADDEQPTCGKWMPRARAYCARKPQHKAECRTAQALADHRARKTARRIGGMIDPQARARWARKHRLSRYGLTQEGFDRLLEFQAYACAMGGEPFTEDSVICIDHDHACCPDEKKSCGKCIRGLLCLSCNTALGHIERKLKLAQAYLDTRAGLIEFLLSTGD